MSTKKFSSLALHQALLDNLQSLDYTEMTEIQERSLPAMLQGRDIIGQGRTGSGKTAAFGLGLLQKLNVKRFRVQALVLCPTRELADQVATELRRLARKIHNIKILTLCGGAAFGPQVNSLEHGAHIIVGTPGRVEEHLRKNNLRLADVHTLVLDEADRMLDMGFQESLDNITAQIPNQRQTLLFSATFPEKIQEIAQRVMRNPLLVQVESTHSEDSISQYFFNVGDGSKRLQALRLLLLKYRPESAIIFCNTKLETQSLASALADFGFSAKPLHGDLEQRERDETLLCFANKSISLLVATDVAARGLDIASLDIVFNYELPRELAVFTHRIGRTGRAGKTGIACTLYSEKERYKLELLETQRDYQIESSELPVSKELDMSDIKPAMMTIEISGGKKQKVRAGDILGALTRSKEIAGDQIGKIKILDNRAYVAVSRTLAKLATKHLAEGNIKGKKFKVRLLSF